VEIAAVPAHAIARARPPSPSAPPRDDGDERTADPGATVATPQPAARSAGRPPRPRGGLQERDVALPPRQYLRAAVFPALSQALGHGVVESFTRACDISVVVHTKRTGACAWLHGPRLQALRSEMRGLSCGADGPAAPAVALARRLAGGQPWAVKSYSTCV
jgi:hypothetical protein